LQLDRGTTRRSVDRARRARRHSRAVRRRMQRRDGSRGDRSADALARLAERAYGCARSAAARRAQLPPHACRERVREPRRKPFGDRVAEGIARRGRGGAPPARRSARAQTGVSAREAEGRRGGTMAKLSSSDVEQRMKRLTGWTLDGDAIRKQYTFAGFPEAV